MNVLKIIMLKADRDCWQALFELRGSIYDHRVRSETRENDYKHVANMIQSTRRDQETRGNAGIYDEIQETDCYLQALGLEMRVDNILIAELLTSVHLLEMGDMRPELDLQRLMEDCKWLAAAAARAGPHRNAQQVEAQIFLIQLYALEQLHTAPSKAQSYLELGNATIIKTRTLLWKLPAREFTSELKNAEKMLKGEAAYPSLPSDERMAAIWALEPPFLGT